MLFIASMDRNGGIGFDNGLLIRDKVDMKFFQRVTSRNQFLVMGRKTYDSLPSKEKFQSYNDRKIIIITNVDNFINYFTMDDSSINFFKFNNSNLSNNEYFQYMTNKADPERKFIFYNWYLKLFKEFINQREPKFIFSDRADRLYQRIFPMDIDLFLYALKIYSKTRTFVNDLSELPDKKYITAAEAEKYNIDFFSKRLCVCGGASIYNQLLEYCDEGYITYYDREFDKVDSYLPLHYLRENFEVDTVYNPKDLFPKEELQNNNLYISENDGSGTIYKIKRKAGEVLWL